jgi:transcriptional regulator with XRE-family HTH domain
MTPEQSRMARAALRWSLTDLAEASGVGRATAARFELGQSVEADKVSAMRGALIAAGAQFVRRPGRVGVTVPE